MKKGELKALEILLSEGYGIPKAAIALGRNKITIYRLFQVNGILYNQPKYKYIGGMIGKTGKKVSDNIEKVGKKKIYFNGKSIHNKRTTLGHWESDTVVGKRKTRTKKCILTNVDRKSGFLIARILNNAQAQSVVNATLKDFSKLPKYKRKTMTFDNGREFAYHYDIERELNITTYFTHPYCSWERGTNENTNGLLRQFLPKGTDFELLTEKELQKYVVLINNRPREKLGFLTLYEVFNNKSKSCIGL